MPPCPWVPCPGTTRHCMPVHRHYNNPMGLGNPFILLICCMVVGLQAFVGFELYRVHQHFETLTGLAYRALTSVPDKSSAPAGMYV